MEVSRLTHKSEDMKQLCLSHGWKAEVYPDLEEFDLTGDPETIRWKLYAIRGEEDAQETLKVEWKSDLQTGCIYTYGEHYRLTPARKAPVIRLITGTPDPKKLKIPGAPDPDQPHWGEMVADWAAFDIMLDVVGKRIYWVQKLTGEEKDARVEVDLREPGSARNFRVYEAPSGRRILEWADSLGFHCVGIDQIFKVI